MTRPFLAKRAVRLVPVKIDLAWSWRMNRASRRHRLVFLGWPSDNPNCSLSANGLTDDVYYAIFNSLNAFRCARRCSVFERCTRTHSVNLHNKGATHSTLPSPSLLHTRQCLYVTRQDRLGTILLLHPTPVEEC